MAPKRPPRQLTIAAFAPNDWFGRTVSRQHLLSGLARRGWPIVYSSGVPSAGSARFSGLRWTGSFDEDQGVHIARASKLLPRWKSFPLWDRVAVAAHGHQIRQFLARSAPGSRLVAYVFHPSFLRYVDSMQADFLVYHAYDAYSLTRGWTKAHERWQAELVQRANLVVGASQSILDLLPPCEGKSRELTNGADFTAFADGPATPCPADLAEIPPPRICYAGAVNAKVDVELILELARRHRQWNWVILGEDLLSNPKGEAAALLAGERQAWKTARALPNVHFLGLRPLQQVPSYVGHADVNVMIYRSSTEGWWSHGSPLKMYEYLAVGKPVVSASLPTVTPYSNVIALADSLEEWETAISAALAGGGAGTPAERQRIASQNGWETRVSQLEQWLEEFCR
jgi:glycosyltransferase involved in cell wall biosynthesis